MGTYGNTSHPTPHFDALASRSVVAEWMWADSPNLEGFYRSVWQGVHAVRDEVPVEQEYTSKLLRRAGIRQWLVTDEPLLIEQSTRLPFDEAAPLR